MRFKAQTSEYHDHFSVPYLHDITFNTPIFVINYNYNGREGVLYVKQENAGITGQVNDRIVLYMLKHAQSLILPTRLPQYFQGDEFMKCSLDALLDRLSRDNEINALDSFLLKDHLRQHSESEWEDIMEEVHCSMTFQEAYHQLLFHGIQVDAFVSSRLNDGLLAAAKKYFDAKSQDIKLGYTTNELVSSYVNIPADLYQEIGNCEITKIISCFRTQLGLNIGPVSASNILGSIKMQTTQLQGAVFLTTLVDRQDDAWISQLVGDRCDTYHMPDLVFTSYSVIPATKSAISVF
ncbi:hypothetical protein [Sphingobacterium tabacisoli]|uniref:Uncharacterized protein n=1 Tax=Sphingobacterium tabacisoli TaxID=2044855 RepID=A0ABW5L6F4_9SPHI|nr:hypothetical protein [Sphingobacterium tabacisoli]